MGIGFLAEIIKSMMKDNKILRDTRSNSNGYNFISQILQHFLFWTKLVVHLLYDNPYEMIQVFDEMSMSGEEKTLRIKISKKKITKMTKNNAEKKKIGSLRSKISGWEWRLFFKILEM